MSTLNPGPLSAGCTPSTTLIWVQKPLDITPIPAYAQRTCSDTMTPVIVVTSDELGAAPMFGYTMSDRVATVQYPKKGSSAEDPMVVKDVGSPAELAALASMLDKLSNIDANLTPASRYIKTGFATVAAGATLTLAQIQGAGLSNSNNILGISITFTGPGTIEGVAGGQQPVPAGTNLSWDAYLISQLLAGTFVIGSDAGVGNSALVMWTYEL